MTSAVAEVFFTLGELAGYIPLHKSTQLSRPSKQQYSGPSGNFVGAQTSRKLSFSGTRSRSGKSWKMGRLDCLYFLEAAAC